ncbi:hypothetical protein GJ496_007373 [Pomphorhynchus laevis]|nr:hypothetical protein GJ496_007373 [Pomphorhynchus laevis]
MDTRRRSLLRWPNKNAHLLSILQNIIGIGNIATFFIGFVNGGGIVMLIPLFIFTFTIGIPVMYMELLIGQAFRKGSLEVWNELCPFLKGIGYSYILHSVITNMYYLALSGHILNWFISTLSYPNIYSNINDSLNSSIIIPLSNRTDFIGLNPEYLASFLLAVIINYACIQNGALSISRMANFFFIYCNLAVFVLIVKSISSPQSFIGINETFAIDWKQLMKPDTWIDAVTIITFSGSLGSGLLINFSSYAGDYPVNLKTFSAVVLIFDLLYGILCSLQVSASRNTIIIAKSHSSSLNIIQYMPVFYQSMNNGWIYAVIYNLNVLILSITTVFTDIEQIHIALTYKFWCFKHYVRLSRFLLVTAIGCLSSICLTKYGNTIINYFLLYGAKYTTFLIIALESAAICYSYSFKKFYVKVNQEEREKPGKLMLFAWAIFVPIVYISMFVASFATFKSNDFRMVVFEYVLTIIVLSPIPIYMIFYHIFNFIKR